MQLKKISELPIKEITTVDAYVPIIDNVGEDIENYRISLLNLFKTGGIINVNRTYGDGNYTLPTALAVIEPTLLNNGVFITFRGMDGWELYQKEGSEYIKYINRVDDALENGSDNPISNDAVTRMYYELLESINSIAQITHKDVTDKNAETTFQHVDTTTTKETLVEADKVPIYDSVTGKVVLTNNSNIKARYLQNVTANTFVADITYEDFPFKCEIAITGVTSANNAEITFSLAQATSGDLAPICVTDTNKVIIYAKRDLGSIVIPLIKMEVVL